MFITSVHYILGFLSDSYIVEVTYSMKYREDDADHSVESWFVKVIIIVLSWNAFIALLYVTEHDIPNNCIMPIQIPKSDATSSADEVEVFMYKHMFEYLQCYAERTSRKKNEIQMPIPIGIIFKCIK